MAAANAVEPIYELVEHILAEATIRDILASAKVCKAWRAIIGESRQVRDVLEQHHLPTLTSPPRNLFDIHLNDSSTYKLGPSGL